MKTRLLLIAGIICIIVGTHSPSFGDEIKIGYIDLQRVLLNSTRGQEAKDLLAAEFEEKRLLLQKRKEDLEKLDGDIEKKRLILQPEALKEMEKLLEEKKISFQKLYQKHDLELRKKDMDLTQSILLDIEDIINTIGKMGEYTVILEKTESSILFADKSIDLTDKVIKLYNDTTK